MATITWTTSGKDPYPLVTLIIRLFKILDIPVTRSYVKKNLTCHPDYPSLFSVSETLRILGVNNQAVKITINELPEAGTPSLACLNTREFVIVESVENRRVRWLNSKGERAESSFEEFAALWSGVSLILEPVANAGETEYRQRRVSEMVKFMAKMASLFFLPLLMAVIFLGVPFPSGAKGWISPVFALVNLAGLVPCLFILSSTLGGIDFLSHLCPHGKKMNCRKVVGSAAGSILGISLSEAGLAYFMGNMVSLLGGLLTGRIDAVLSCLALLNLLTLPYTVFLILYQALRLKTWCWLCLFMQALIWTDFFLLTEWNPVLHVFAGGTPFVVAPIIIVSFLLSAFWVFLLSRSIRSGNESETLEDELTRIRRKPGYLRLRLAEAEKADMGAFPHEVIIGPHDAGETAVLLISPSCIHCKTVYLMLERLIAMRGGELNGVIRFLADGERTINSAAKTRADLEVSARVIALAASGQDEAAHQALTAWFAAPGAISLKKLNHWLAATPAPSTGLTEPAENLLREYKNWAYERNYYLTPAVFLQGKAVPPEIPFEDMAILLLRGDGEEEA